MTFDEETDAPDPLVAERFQLLDQLTVPPVPTDGVQTFGASAMAVEHPSKRRLTFALAAAAAVLVVGALSALVFTQRDNGQELVALESNEVDAGAAGEDATDATSEPNQDTGSDNSSTSAATADPESEDQQPLVVEDATESTTTSVAEGESGSANGGATSSAAPTTQSTDVGSSTSGSLPDTTVTVPIKTSTTDTVVTTIPTTTTTPATQDGDVTTIRGQLTVVFTDCQSRLVLNESGEVENVGPVSCDGGSHIVVGGNRIQTSAGFVAADAYWDRHPSNLQPGQTVVVTAFAHSSGRLDLSCDQCSVRRG